MKLLLDVDYSADVGDLGDVAMSAAMHRMGICDLIAVTVCTSADKAPGAVAATLKWWGITDVPIGSWKGAAFDPGGTAPYNDWQVAIYDGYDRNGYGLTATVENANTIFRTALAAAEDNSVVIVAGGPLNNISAFLQTPADGISSMTGSELIAAKVKEFHPCVGDFPQGSEWNANVNATAAAAAAYVALNWPSTVPLYWFDVASGSAPVVGGNLTSKPADDLMRVGYSKSPSNGAGREAWVQLQLLGIITGWAGFEMSVAGRAVFNATTGADTFAPNLSENQFFYKKPSTANDSTYQAQINAMLGADVEADPLLPSWGAAAPIVMI